MKIPHSSIRSVEASRQTKRRRTDTMIDLRKQLSLGDCDSELTDELKVIPKEEREQLMKAANFTISIPPEEGLAMKSDLCIPWRKLRLMRR